MSDRVLFRGETLSLGEFRCDPASSRWSRENYTGEYLMGFPRDPVMIRQAGREAVIADANQITFYNAGQEYRRARVAGHGDRCEYLVLSPALAMELGGGMDDARGGVFTFAAGPARPRVYLSLRRVYEHLVAAASCDGMRIEEILLRLVDVAVADARGAGRAAPGSAEHAERVKSLLAADPARRMTLQDVAAAVELSVFYMCRVFRRHTGLPIYRYRDRLRARAALEPLADGADDLTALAHRLGYASHSHFTDAFRREFGVPPSRFRAAAGALPRAIRRKPRRSP